MPTIVLTTSVLERIEKHPFESLFKIDSVHVEDHAVGGMSFFWWSEEWVAVGVDKVVATGGVDADIDASVVGHFENIKGLFDVLLELVVFVFAVGHVEVVVPFFVESYDVFVSPLPNTPLDGVDLGIHPIQD